MSTDTIHCVKCGHDNPVTNAACTECGEFLSRVPATPAHKPGKVQAIAIVCLVDGIANVAWGLFAAASLFAMNLYACVQTPYCLLLGGLEIGYAMKLLSNPVKPVRPAKYLAVMQIINVASLNLFGLWAGSLIIGVLCLIFYNDALVAAFFGSLQAQESK